MRKLIESTLVSLDGVIEAPERWASFDAEATAVSLEQLGDYDAFVMGRVTYDGFAAAWPAMEEVTGEFGKRMNNMPKVVVSTTLTDPAWKNTTVISGDVPAEVARLKEQYQGDVLVPASATLVDTLREHDLVDEYHLMVHPIVLGTGKRLFKEGAAGTELALTDCRKVGPDVLLLIYRPASRQSGSPAS